MGESLLKLFLQKSQKNPETNSGFIRKNQEDTRLERNTDTVSNFLIGFHDAAEVLTETILVELLHGLLVPEPAPVRRELIAKEELAVELAELKLEVNKDKACVVEELLEDVVDLEAQGLHLIDVLLGAPAEGDDVGVIDHRIMKGIILQEELKGRSLELRPSLTGRRLQIEPAV